MPETVKQEVLPDKALRGEKAIADALDASWIKVWPEAIEPRLEIDLDAGDFRISAAVFNQVLISVYE
ncbi:MAG: hypothetical protein NTV43_14090 [Methylococcales bacterium]|nr:hypothetical protein [Methylococcales bacterium]